MSIIQTHYLFFRYSTFAVHEGVPATEKTVYAVQSQSESLITLNKDYELDHGVHRQRQAAV